MNLHKLTHIRYLAVGVLIVALVVNFGLGLGAGIDRPMTSDSLYFRHLAENMAAGEGYIIKEGFWPADPSMRRLPGWPAVILAAIKLVPFASPDAVMRSLDLLINSLTALILFLLTFRILKRKAPAFIAALIYIIHPSALHSAYMGLSEPLFVFLVAGGILLLLNWPRPSALAGFILLGSACLVRANFVLWIGFFAVFCGLRLLYARVLPDRKLMGLAAISVILFCLPSSLWMLRNSRVCGHFPVMSTIRGQTFYGGNNEVVAEDLGLWGYWIFPDSVPGETPMRELASTKSEYEVDDYYFRKGTAFVERNIRDMPRLWLGKMIRAFVPIPWKFSFGSWAVCVFRWLIYIGALLGLRIGWRGVPRGYNAFLLSTVAVTVITVLGFWGCSRFAFAMEPFLLPIAGAGVAGVPAMLKQITAPKKPL